MDHHAPRGPSTPTTDPWYHFPSMRPYGPDDDEHVIRINDLVIVEAPGRFYHQQGIVVSWYRGLFQVELKSPRGSTNRTWKIAFRLDDLKVVGHQSIDTSIGPNPYLTTINAKDQPLTWMKYKRHDPLGDYDRAQRQSKHQSVNKMLLSLQKSTSDMSIQFQTCKRIWMDLLEIRSQENWNVFQSNLSLLKELSGQNWRTCQQLEREMRGEHHVAIEESSKVRGRIDNWIKRAHSASALMHG